MRNLRNGTWELVTLSAGKGAVGRDSDGVSFSPMVPTSPPNGPVHASSPPVGSEREESGASIGLLAPMASPTGC